MDLKGTKTEKNLMEAFAGESQARNKYTYYASQAKKDGYVQIAQIFEETAKNEQEHAKLWFKLLHGGAVPTTEVNLQDAANGENFEWTDMYDRMAREAREEGMRRNRRRGSRVRPLLCRLSKAAKATNTEAAEDFSAASAVLGAKVLGFQVFPGFSLG